ncbi:acyltransferase [Teredinibacter sp. KSP-S5-2]|uniref:acyltransferase family protein n=1 Tax=Teredinibacter sp. KSP-S5-2 TaxID=3034506 RepID=UPI0029351A7F|nr:acyltransferase [Teredinibacter sp. KSP-S5-2]WNO10038.1 acyltransferase [Teredinibacter sp. KSP-S5-2]
MSSTKTRFYEIDFLRFLSAFFVVVFHYTFTASVENFSPVANFEAVRYFSKYAYMGINFFFLISGFVIFMSVSNGSAKKFLISRFTRLFPAYWFALLVTSVATVYLGGEVFDINWVRFIANITMINELFGQKPIESAYWTLFIELKFYLLIYVLLLLGLMKYYQHIIAIVLVGSLAALFSPLGISSEPFLHIFPHWSGYFAAGSALYLVKRDGPSLYRVSLVVLSYLFILKQSTLFGELMTGWLNYEFRADVIVVLNSAFFFFFCAIAFMENNILRKKWCLHLGVLTYPLYLIHQHLGYMLFNQFGTEDNIGYLVVGMIVVMLVIAYFMHTQVEKRLAPLFKTFGQKILRVSN